MEKEYSNYIGEIINGLLKEAAFYKAKCLAQEEQLKAISEELLVSKKQAFHPGAANYSDVTVDSSAAIG